MKPDGAVARWASDDGAAAGAAAEVADDLHGAQVAAAERPSDARRSATAHQGPVTKATPGCVTKW